MKVNVEHFRYLTEDDFGVLYMMENATKKQQVVPLATIENKLASTRNMSNGQVSKTIHHLCHIKLIHRAENANCQGYRMGYGAYDYLALYELSSRGIIEAVGNQLGVGKESDIFVVMTPDNGEAILKLHRLGRTSFKKGVKEHRDYYHFDQGSDLNHSSWLLKSRIAARREFQFLQLLSNQGLLVPTPLGWSRHCVVMTRIDGDPLYQIREVEQPERMLSAIVEQLYRILELGYVHGDLNEFNLILSTESCQPYIIDFPQMIQTKHPKAHGMLIHDLNCIETFFLKKFSIQMDQSIREKCDILFNRHVSNADDDCVSE